MSVVRRVTIQISRPMGNDCGAVEEGHFIIQDGAVILTDANGRPLYRSQPRYQGDKAAARWERKFSDSEYVELVAKRLLWAFVKSQKSGRNFLKPLRYPVTRAV